jgi:hypothetical protein
MKVLKYLRERREVIAFDWGALIDVEISALQPVLNRRE